MTDILVPRMKPAGPDTWELRAILPRTDEETARIPIDFPGPSLVVGAYCSVIQDSSAGGALLVPTLDDILCLVDLDQQRRFTSGPSQVQSSAASRSSQYVTLAALDSRIRDLYWDCSSPKPTIGVTFRWKRFTAGTPLYEDANLGIALVVIPRDQR